MIENRKMNQVNTISEKKFGIFFGAVGFVIFGYQYFYAHQLQWATLLAGIAALVLAFFMPSVYKYPNMLWFYLGIFLQKLFSPVLLAVMFFIILLPFGLAKRWFSKSKNTVGKTGWVEVNQTYDADSFKHLF